MAQPTPSLYALDPALPALLRPDGAVQVGRRLMSTKTVGPSLLN
jgi:hypothetical protein